jgi:hypothetical protein
LVKLFSLAKKAQREKLGKRESAEIGISPVATGEEAYAASTAPPFEKGGRKPSSS